MGLKRGLVGIKRMRISKWMLPRWNPVRPEFASYIITATITVYHHGFGLVGNSAHSPLRLRLGLAAKAEADERNGHQAGTVMKIRDWDGELEQWHAYRKGIETAL